jgi:hypothetical protein
MYPSPPKTKIPTHCSGGRTTRPVDTCGSTLDTYFKEVDEFEFFTLPLDSAISSTWHARVPFTGCAGSCFSNTPSANPAEAGARCAAPARESPWNIPVPQLDRHLRRYAARARGLGRRQIRRTLIPALWGAMVYWSKRYISDDVIWGHTIPPQVRVSAAHYVPLCGAYLTFECSSSLSASRSSFKPSL